MNLLYVTCRLMSQFTHVNIQSNVGMLLCFAVSIYTLSSVVLCILSTLLTGVLIIVVSDKCTKHQFIHFLMATLKNSHVENSKNHKR